MDIECPWCAAPATIAIVDPGATNADPTGGAFSCPACAIRVDLAPDPAPTPIARAA